MSDKAETPICHANAKRIDECMWLSLEIAEQLECELTKLREGEEILWQQIRQRDEAYQVLSQERDQWREIAGMKNWDVDDWCQLIVVIVGTIVGAILAVRWLW